MARTPTLTRNQVPEKLRAAFDSETAGSGGTITGGPGSVMIHNPEMRRRANQLVNYLRDESSLSKKIQELVMILTARAMDCQYIWHAHSARARQQGISGAFVNALRDNRPLPPLPAEEQIVVNYVQELFKTHKTSPSTFQAALKQFSAQGLTELTTLMGYYTLLAFNANSFEIDVPPGGTEPKLPI
ncbi:MAG TPA: carboxymuconolactone decarboxylase family protein [Dehalococcoidia bacterium]|nr:carboxymuconolactone decarboxylase family protein [Dehalococcoidia bacterium]